MAQDIETLARFVANTRFEDIPDAVVAHARRILLDTLGVILAGSERPEVRGLRERLASTAGRGATVSQSTASAPTNPSPRSIHADSRRRSEGSSAKYRSWSCVNTEPGVEKNAAYTRRPTSCAVIAPNILPPSPVLTANARLVFSSFLARSCAKFSSVCSRSARRRTTCAASGRARSRRCGRRVRGSAWT